MKRVLYIIIFIISFSVTYFYFLRKEEVSTTLDYKYEENLSNKPFLLNRDSIYRKVELPLSVKKRGLINNSQIALDAALIIVAEIYGEQVLGQKPYIINCNGDLWSISGSVPRKYRNSNYIYHGCFNIILNKYNGEIYNIWID